MAIKRDSRFERSTNKTERKPPPMPWARSHGHFIDGQAIIDGVDLVARDVEARYGVDRVRLLLPDDMRARFDRQRAKFIGSIWDGDLPELQVQARRMIAAWRDVDAEAAKHPNAFQPVEILAETPLGHDRVLVIVRRDEDLMRASQNGSNNQRTMTLITQNGSNNGANASRHASHASRQVSQNGTDGPESGLLGASSPTDSRKREIWSLEEIARLIEGEAFVSAIKLRFEGAKVMGVRQTIGDPLQAIESGQNLDDEIPF